MGNKILYVEDDVLVGKFVAEVLSQKNVWVVLVTTAKDALAALEANGDDFAMVLSDQSLPDQKGLELLASVGNLYPHLRRVITTGFVDTRVEHEAQSLDGLLPKPFSIDDIFAFLAQFEIANPKS